jgi:hypothetical protein
MPALVAAQQAYLDADERVGIVKHIELQVHECRSFLEAALFKCDGGSATMLRRAWAR